MASSVIGAILRAIKTALHGPMTAAEVERTLKALGAQSEQILDWQHSVVDLMKLLGLDSSLEARKQLATELGYEGTFTGTPAENTRLHELVMAAVAERTVPA